MKALPQAILEAQRRIVPFIHHTPLVRSAYLSRLCGANVWLKLECWQPTGSFKARGALNKVGLLAGEQTSRGIVTGSAGNHGLGVAYAAQSWGGIDADIFVPKTVPRAKLEGLGAFDVRVHVEGDVYEDAHRAAQAFADEMGATYIEAYDDEDVIAGQGTIGLEIVRDLPSPDAILVPIGGGGLVAGVAVAVKERAPECRIIGVQPEASPAALLSLRDAVAYDPFDHSPTLADGLAGGFGAVPLAIAHSMIDRVLLVSELELRGAIFCLLDQEQLVVEPSGAIAIAPLLAGAVDVQGANIVCILSGRNIDTELLRDILVEFAV